MHQVVLRQMLLVTQATPLPANCRRPHNIPVSSKRTNPLPQIAVIQNLYIYLLWRSVFLIVSSRGYCTRWEWGKFVSRQRRSFFIISCKINT